MKKLIIVGAGAFAEVACEYFTDDSDYEVVAFAVERDHLTDPTYCNLPVCPLEDLLSEYPVQDHHFFVAITYNELNRLRRRLFDRMKTSGYRPASYVSSNAFVASSAELGPHCFVMEANVVQPRVRIGENVILWSGNHIGHHSVIEEDCFVSSHVVVSGFCHIGRRSFLGVNATISNNITIGEDCWIGPACNITSNTKPAEIFKAAKAEPAKISSLRFFKVRD